MILRTVLFLVVFVLLLQTGIHAQDNDQDPESRIKALLQEQVDCWNRGDIDGFMQTYWKSPELTFSSGGSTTRGWQQTLDRYKAKYSTRELMGTLEFGELEVTMLNRNSAFVLGTWMLTRNDDRPHGNFSLVLRRIEGEWRIVHDHSSAVDEDE